MSAWIPAVDLVVLNSNFAWFCLDLSIWCHASYARWWIFLIGCENLVLSCEKKIFLWEWASHAISHFPCTDWMRLWPLTPGALRFLPQDIIPAFMADYVKYDKVKPRIMQARQHGHIRGFIAGRNITFPSQLKGMLAPRSSVVGARRLMWSLVACTTGVWMWVRGWGWLPECHWICSVNHQQHCTSAVTPYISNSIVHQYIGNSNTQSLTTHIISSSINGPTVPVYSPLISVLCVSD